MKKIILILFLINIQIISANTNISKNINSNSILFLGDSLTEGLGVNKEEAFPKLVEILIKNKLKKDITVINGGVSGSTTSDGLSRLKWYLKKTTIPDSYWYWYQEVPHTVHFPHLHVVSHVILGPI